jgi:hypothetical protein
MREIRLSGSEGGAGQLNAPFLPLSVEPATHRCVPLPRCRRIAHNDRCIPRDLPPAFRQELARFCRIGP